MKNYTNNLIVSSKNISPPYEWSDGIFQRYLPISGDFKIGPGLDGNNPTGRGFNANGLGYWDQAHDQFNSGKSYPEQLNGALFPTTSGNILSRPQDSVVFGYARIGENYRNK